MLKKCPACGPEKIVPNVVVTVVKMVERTGELSQVHFDAKPDALLFKGRTSGGACTCSLCAECGHISLWAADPDAIWQAYQKSSGGREA
jgi:hypothetical protein